MCFGNTKTKTDTQTQTLPGWLTDAAQSNIGIAQGLNAKGFTPYGGNQVADFSGQQNNSFQLGSDVAGGVAPYVGQTGGLISNYANAGPQHVSAPTISSMMSPYMNQYVQQALAPQLNLQDQQFAAQNKGFDSSATGAGAFGDTGWGIGKTNLTNQQNIARTGLIGNAYNAAFNTAIGAGAQDVANNINTQGTNASLAETALGRQLGGANALYGQGTGATNLINTLGGQQTGQDQARLNAQYNQWMMAQQYPFQTLQALNQTLGSAAAGAPKTTTNTSSAPDNSGWGMLGSALGTGAGFLVGGPMGAAVGGSLGGSLANGLMNSGAVNPTSYTNGAVLPYDTSGQKWYADGGRTEGGKPIVVGERGPELFVPNSPGVVVPNEVMEAAREKRGKKVAKQADSLARQLGIAA